MLEFSGAPGNWPSCCRGIREREREGLDNTENLVFCEHLMGIMLVLLGNVYSL
jgi:hypothetical protein